MRQRVRLRGGRHRTLDERLAVAAPGIARRIASLVWRLPPGSRLRRALVARNLRSQYEAVNRRDYELILARCDPEAEWVFVGGAKPPDMERSYRGRSGGMAFMRGWFETWGELRLEPVEVIDAGDGRLAAIYRQRGRARDSGIELDESGAQMITVRDGAAVLIRTFAEPTDALAEIGAADATRGRATT